MEGFEPPASCSQSRRATNCATPGYLVVLSGWAYSPKPPALPTALYPDTVVLFSAVCGHLCGQSGFLARLCALGKSRKRPYRKAFRASASQVVDGVGNTPKPGALPTASYLAIESFSIGNLIILDNVFILHFFAIKSRAYSVPRSYVQHPNDRVHSNSRTQKDAAAWSWWRDSNT